MWFVLESPQYSASTVAETQQYQKTHTTFFPISYPSSGYLSGGRAL
jgi:hypothetical protein